jgi:DNA-binding transcriptional ArsR family regulator
MIPLPAAVGGGPGASAGELAVPPDLAGSIIFLDRHIPLWEYIGMSTFTALADPIRRDILAHLRVGEQPVGVLVDKLALPQPNVSKHLQALRVAGLVRIRIDGPRRFYSLNVGPLAELDEWLAPYRAFWSEKLDALGDHLNRSD